MPSKGLLWEQIHPQDSKSQPVRAASGKYHVKCFVMGEWRRVTVDDRIPVDAFGAPLLVGSMPSQLWPLILSKAVIKLMALCQVLDMSLWHQVAAFQWLTGWPQENLMDPMHGVRVAGSTLYDRLHESCEQRGSGVARRAMTMAHLKDQARDKLRRPSFLVLCSPSGLPVEEVMQQLTAQHPSSTGRIVTHSSRVPLEHEVQGGTYNFVLPDSMQADKQAGKFLEASMVEGPHWSGMFGIAFSAISSVAATGRVGIVRVDTQGVQSLKGNNLVDAVYVNIAPASMEAWAQEQSLRQVTLSTS
ncbi:adenylate kinase [Trebouxia sp. C0010 RCD-2024]